MRLAMMHLYKSLVNKTRKIILEAHEKEYAVCESKRSYMLREMMLGV